MQSKYALISSNLLVNENFQVTWNKPISSLFSKSHVLQKIITDEWVYFQYSLRHLRNFKKPTFNTLLRNLMKVSVGFSKRYGTWSCLPFSGFVNLYTAWLWPSLNLLEDYLSNHKKRIKADSFISSWEDILSGVYKAFVQFVPCSWYWKQSTLIAMQMITHVLWSQVKSKIWYDI